MLLIRHSQWPIVSEKAMIDGRLGVFGEEESGEEANTLPKLAPPAFSVRFQK